MLRDLQNKEELYKMLLEEYERLPKNLNRVTLICTPRMTATLPVYSQTDQLTAQLPATDCQTSIDSQN